MATCNNCRMKIPAYSFICPHCRLDTMIRGKVPKTNNSSSAILGNLDFIIAIIVVVILWNWISGSTWEDWFAWFNHVGKFISDPAYRDLKLNSV